jgi:hypothetical protein
MTTVPQCVLQRFVRVEEQAAPDVVTYRASASGTPLPRSRVPRPFLQFDADGTVVRGVPGPADARIPHRGRWVATGPRELTLHWDDGAPDTVAEIVACDDEVLQLRVLSGAL